MTLKASHDLASAWPKENNERSIKNLKAEKALRVLEPVSKGQSRENCGEVARLARRAKAQAGGEITMGVLKDLSGQRFGNLEVLVRAPDDSDRSRNTTWWVCRCDCGRTAIAAANKLRGGNKKSCGHLCPCAFPEKDRGNPIYRARMAMRLSQKEFARLVGTPERALAAREKKLPRFFYRDFVERFNAVVPKYYRIRRVWKKNAGGSVAVKIRICEQCLGSFKIVLAMEKHRKTDLCVDCSRRVNLSARAKPRRCFLCSCGCGRVACREKSALRKSVFFNVECYNRTRKHKMLLAPHEITQGQAQALDALRVYPDAPLSAAEVQQILNPKSGKRKIQSKEMAAVREIVKLAQKRKRKTVKNRSGIIIRSTAARNFSGVQTKEAK